MHQKQIERNTQRMEAYRNLTIAEEIKLSLKEALLAIICYFVTIYHFLVC